MAKPKKKEHTRWCSLDLDHKGGCRHLWADGTRPEELKPKMVIKKSKLPEPSEREA